MAKEKPGQAHIPVVAKEDRLSKMIGIHSLTGFLAVVIIAWLIFTFVTGRMYRFYASALFLFYALTKKMWVSVMMLGVFQTFILIPLRIIRLQRQNNIEEFQKAVERLPSGILRQKKVKDSYKMGNRTFLFYMVDFMVQLLTFLTIGRLFLTDFYSVKLDPSHLFDFVPYPQYPILDTWFKIPYVVIAKTISLGWHWVLISWAVIIGFYLLILITRRITRMIKQRKPQTKDENKKLKLITRYTGSSIIFIMLLVWLLLTHIPVDLDLKIFSGDVGVPNYTLNSITAIATFTILLYFGIPKIVRKGKLALKHGIAKKVVEKTQKSMFRETLVSAIFVGLGAFFITNQIPSAFELSIFTLEVISLLSPLTLDKMILKSKSMQLDGGTQKAKQENDEIPIEFIAEQRSI